MPLDPSAVKRGLTTEERTPINSEFDGIGMADVVRIGIVACRSVASRLIRMPA